VPSGRRFAAGALASVVAVFGVLALRVHDGADPALGHAASPAPATNSTVTQGDDETTTLGGDDGSSSSSSSSSGVTATPPATTSAS
jgi:hypothetical protein